MNINEISKEINENNHAKGFWDKGVDVPQKLMLIVSEVSEAMEADRTDKYCANNLNGIPDFQTDTPSHAFEGSFKALIKDSFQDELADAVIRIFDLAYEMGIDLQFHIEQKVRYNAGRPKMHGGKKY